ncbi:MAG: 16S rRNA (adenine(1518)-N(6)/adenine(1519)-N(6))-dimethyltransferase RsmA [bacterium]|nr:16S rRNA (adenine(1518)-N(6)/adenine(1519)-N(6))-dimethyltransferase RsmA [bacterium]
MSRPKLGQHWLDDKRYAREIVDAIVADREHVIIEIGGGRGALTRFLIPISGRLIVYEIDNKWSEHLTEYGPGWDDSGREFRHVEIRQHDALKIEWDRDSLGLKENERVIICGNLPYYITSPLLLRLAYSRMDFEQATFLIQKEVAEKIASKPNSSDYGRLTVSLGAFFKSEIILHIPPEAFSPRPKVMSSLIRLIPHKTPLMNTELIGPFERIVQASFHMRRKTLKNNLIVAFPQKSPDEIAGIIAGIGANPTARAQELSVEDFIKITELLK